MAKYLEYDKVTGRIISEIISAQYPETTANYQVLEIPEDLEVNTALYAIRDGQLVKIYETNEQRLERERVRREQGEQVRQRIKAIVQEVSIAMLEGDEKTLNSLRAEYKKLKGYL